MGKRFDNTNRLLSLMKNGRCLDDLLAFQVEEPPAMKELFRIENTMKLEGRKKPNEVERIVGSTMARSLDAWMKESRDFFRHDRIGFSCDEQKCYDVLVNTCDGFEENMDNLFNERKPTAYFITADTSKAIMETGRNLKDKIGHLAVDLPVESGIIMCDKIGNSDMKGYYMAYHIENCLMSAVFILETKSEGIAGLMIHNPFHIDLKSGAVTKSGKASDTMSQAMASVMGFYVAAIFFIHFFETERVISVQPVANAKSSSRQVLNGETYDSTITYPVNIIDAHWYTSILRTDPFLVRGHFRSQRYGAGRGKVRVQWIAAFQKNGYTRKAGKKTNQSPLTTEEDAASTEERVESTVEC